MIFLDTQILFYKFRKNEQLYSDSIYGQSISSIVALEFLNVFKKDDFNRANYYPFILKGHHTCDLGILGGRRKLFDSPKHCQMGKHRTDSIIIDFKEQFESFKIFGNSAISQLLNAKNKQGIMVSTMHLEKADRKKISEKIDFILESNLTVVPLNSEIVLNMLQIMDAISENYNMKKDYHNSVMDLLIASTALTLGMELCTLDSELYKTLQRMHSISIKFINELIFVSNFSSEGQEQKYTKTDSKGFVNRGWQYYMTHNYNNF